MHVILVCAYAPCSTSFPVLPHQAHIWKYCSPACYHLARTTQTHEAFAARFWSKVAIADPEECWLWTGALHGQSGYGNFRATPYKPGNVSAHVASYFLATGSWPEAGLLVLHTCDTPPCVNPAHLFPGTHADNMQDSMRKGRNGMTTQPERALEGIRRYNLEHPTRPQTTGDRNGMRLHPDRVPRGERSGMSKLTDAQWAEALALYATGQWTGNQLGKRYGISGVAMNRRLRSHKTSTQ